MNIKFKFILLGLIILGSLACQRNNMPYGGVTNDTNPPPYNHQFNINSQNTQK